MKSRMVGVRLDQDTYKYILGLSRAYRKDTSTVLRDMIKFYIAQMRLGWELK